MKGKCPFNNFKICREDCVFYRRGLRYYNDGQTTPFEECKFNIDTDCLENLVTRFIGNQKATEETRNEITKLNTLFYGMAETKLLGEH